MMRDCLTNKDCVMVMDSIMNNEPSTSVTCCRWCILRTIEAKQLTPCRLQGAEPGSESREGLTSYTELAAWTCGAALGPVRHQR